MIKQEHGGDVFNVRVFMLERLRAAPKRMYTAIYCTVMCLKWFSILPKWDIIQNLSYRISILLYVYKSDL